VELGRLERTLDRRPLSITWRYAGRLARSPARGCEPEGEDIVSSHRCDLHLCDSHLRAAVLADPRSHLPLRPKVFHLLLALDRQAQHGYGLKKSIRERTQGAVELDPGGLYRLVARLEEEGLIEPTTSPEGQAEDPRRRYYALTTWGREVLRAEARRLSELVSGADVVALARHESSA